MKRQGRPKTEESVKIKQLEEANEALLKIVVQLHRTRRKPDAVSDLWYWRLLFQLLFAALIWQLALVYGT